MDGKTDHWNPCRHGLQDHVWHSLPTGRKQQQVKGSYQRWDVIRPAEEHHAITKAMSIHLFLEGLVQRSVPGNHQVVIRERFEELWKMVDQGSDPLLWMEPADITEHPATGPEAPLLR